MRGVEGRREGDGLLFVFISSSSVHFFRVHTFSIFFFHQCSLTLLYWPTVLQSFLPCEMLPFLND